MAAGDGNESADTELMVADDKRRWRTRRRQMMRLPTVRLRHHGDLVALIDGDVLVSTAVGPRGQLVTLWSDEPGREALTSYEIQQPTTVIARVVEFWPAPALTVSFAELRLAFPTVQPLPDDRTLIVGARTGGVEHNAAVYDGSGELVMTGPLGDGIEYVRTTAAGDIWIGYFDEGVYGNDPLGGYGLVRFSKELEPSWRYTAPGGIGPIDDCYALNVTDHEVWTCYYNSFPVVRIQDGHATGWNSGRPAHALIAYGDSIALVRGYGVEHDWGAVGTLAGDRLVIEREFRLTLPDGSELPEEARIFGHGSELHAITDTAWLKVGLGDLHA